MVSSLSLRQNLPRKPCRLADLCLCADGRSARPAGVQMSSTSKRLDPVPLLLLRSKFRKRKCRRRNRSSDRSQRAQLVHRQPQTVQGRPQVRPSEDVPPPRRVVPPSRGLLRRERPSHLVRQTHAVFLGQPRPGFIRPPPASVYATPLSPPLAIERARDVQSTFHRPLRCVDNHHPNADRLPARTETQIVRSGDW